MAISQKSNKPVIFTCLINVQINIRMEIIPIYPWRCQFDNLFPGVYIKLLYMVNQNDQNDEE